ncbi:MAG TPA: EamA family transporter [Clostridiales bacterium]|nr:EamA family transporter [Clostridiales bacterium]
MNRTQLKANLYLLLAAAIWGFSFVAQRVGVRYVGSFYMNGIRFAVGVLVLLPVLLLRRRSDTADRRKNILTLKAGLLAGIILFAAVSLQQLGIVGTSAGKSAFITSLYIILVPVFGLLLGRRIGLGAWLGTACAAAGLYFLCVTEALTISGYDLLILGSAVLYTVHILLVDHYSSRVYILKMALCQFAVCAVLSLAVAAAAETITWAGVRQAAVPLLYGGIGSVGIAFTLQLAGQKDASPTSAAIILGSESLFALLGGFLILQERMDGRGIAGIILMISGIVLSQLPARTRTVALGTEVKDDVA